MPGTVTAVCQMPCISSTTNACPMAVDKEYPPPALQSPGEVHDTDPRSAVPPWSSATSPGTAVAACQVPWTSLVMNARQGAEGPDS
jgi:hypothetical protein